MMTFVALMGVGMGFSIPPLLIAVQTTVERRQSRHCHLDDPIQPLDRRDSRRERDGRRPERAPRLEPERLGPGPEPGLAIARSPARRRGGHQSKRAHRDRGCHQPGLPHRLRCRGPCADRHPLHPAQ
ncbi:MAG: hypothetical protein MZU91_01845 [Desulfosudis oleivorans]|nr:hypothetical protein [Desulfosudis oleivorans]